MRNLFCLLIGGLMVGACAPSTPQARIQQNPAAFAALPPKHQEMVQQGVIAKGMQQDAVLLAWGPPSMRFDGFREGKPNERWDYNGSQPVYTSSFSGGYGFGRPYGRFGGAYAPFGFGPTVTYIPYNRSRVWFVSGRVDAWERLR